MASNPQQAAMNDRPVSSQLQRIEDGLDMLLQSHAALEKQLEAIDVVGDANREESGSRHQDIRDSFNLIAKGLNAIAQRLENIEAFQSKRHKAKRRK